MHDLYTLLAQDFIGYVVGLVLALLGGAAGMLLRQATKYVGLQNSALLDSKIEYVVKNAIALAQERVAALIKTRELPADVSHGVFKLAQATAYILERIPGISQEEAEALVHAYLARMGQGASEFVRDLRAAATTNER